MAVEQGLIPPGPAGKYDTSEDLLRWMSEQFDRFGSIYRASAYGTEDYVVSDPEHVDHVLRINWKNYKKGQAIKRIAFLLGNGLMVSGGQFWKSQRRMIQPSSIYSPRMRRSRKSCRANSTLSLGVVTRRLAT